MAQVAEHLVGRDEELGSLERMLDEVDAGRSGALALVGEPGIGKTRLLTELGARAESRGHLVLYGSASELERDLPFSVFVDALNAYLGGLDAKELVTLDEAAQAELAHVFPSLAALGRGRELALQQERYRTHRAVRALLEHLARPRPLVLALDDLQWADSASIELLGALLRRLPGGAVLLALALRSRRVPEPLSSALERAQRMTPLARLELGALTSDQARELLGETLDEAEAKVIYEESGGNPFFLEQLARSFDRPDRAAPGHDTSLTSVGVPTAVAASLSEELGRLTDRARLVLEGAAVAGDPFEPDLAADAADTYEAAAMDAIDELLQLDLIRETDVPRRFRFRHPLVRRAVYEMTRGGWRLGAHERCAKALAARGATPAARAYHIERSAREGDLTAVAVLREAGEAAGRLAPASAARWVGAALRLLPETAPAEERVALLMARADSLAATGRFAESRADLLYCVEIAPPDWRVRVATACAAVEHLLGLRTEAHRHLTTALAEFAGAPSAEAIDLMIELSVDGFHVGDFQAMRAWAERAVTAATPLGDRALLAAALAVRAWAGALAGDGNRAETHCDEATGLVDELSDAEVARRLDTLAHLVAADVWLDRYSAATRHGRRALEICRRTGQGEQFPLIVQMLGVSLWVQGKPLEAGELFDGAVEAARLSDNIQNLAWNLFNRSLAALAAGDLDVALATAQESFELEADMEPGPISGATAAVFGSALLEAGQADRSVDLLLTRVGGEELRLIPGGWRARFLEVLTRALLATGRLPDAERAAAATQACADAMSMPTAAAMASLAAAAVALRSNQPLAAAERALSAAAELEGVEAWWDGARARELAGRALARAGERDRAALELERAAAAFDSFGSPRYRDRVERELRKLGRHIHRRTRPGTRDAGRIAALTARESEVARLVVDRKTNAEIAAELFLSQKTVESHLRNIFNKMGVETRVALARAVERGDRTATRPTEPAHHA
jgi:DNA-binding CsgD family transcriptional regulator/tetratricopeptide (TPR) repeat protein